MAVLSKWAATSGQGLVLSLYDRDGQLTSRQDVALDQAVTQAQLIALAGGGVAVDWTGGGAPETHSAFAVYGADGARLGGQSLSQAYAAGVSGFALPEGGFQLDGGGVSQVFDASGSLTAQAALAQPLVFARGVEGDALVLQDNQLRFYAGGVLEASQTLPGEAAHVVTSAALASLAGGDFGAIWTDGQAAYVAVYHAATQTLSQPTLIDGGASANAAIVALPDGGFAVSWTTAGVQKGEAFGPNAELGPSLYLDGSVAGVTSAGELVTLHAAGTGAAEQHYALSYAPPSTPGPQYYNYLGQLAPQSAANFNDVTHSVIGPTQGGATLYAPAAGPSGVAAQGGHNTIIASDGDNSYWMGATDTVVVPDGVTGTKTINAWNSEVLPSGVQNLVFHGAGNWGVGNDLDNLIVMGGNDVNYQDGRAGDDVLVGGFGKNTFNVGVGNGNDVIYNFHTWQDAVRLADTSFSSFAQVKAAMSQVGADVVLKIDAAETLTFRGVQLADFAAKNFLLPLDASVLGSMTFADEFNDLQLLNTSDGAGHWRTNFGGDPKSLNTYQITANQEKQVYTDAAFQGTADHALGYDPFSIDSGVLGITTGRFSYADSQSTWGQAYYSGMLNTKGLFAQKYGYFEMRAELPTTLGTWPAFWLAQDPFVPGNEADVLEHLAMYPNVAFSRSNDNGYVQGGTYYMPDPSGFHTYGMLWTPTNTTFYVDGIGVLQLATPASWSTPMYMIVNLALGGWGGSIDQNGLPAKMNVDYVHAYALADGSSVVQDMTAGSGHVQISTSTYTAASGVTSITLVGSHQTIYGNDLGDTFVSNNTANVLYGGAGADVFRLGRGGDTATGKGGADTFAFAELPWSAGHITDFSAGDRVDLSGLMASIHYTGSDAVADGRLKLTVDGSGSSQIWVNPDPGGPNSAWWLVTTLDGVAPSALQVQGGAVVGSSPPPVSTPGQTFTSDNSGPHWTGTAGDDLFRIGRGGDVVTGAGGADTFAFAETPWAGAHITDFTSGVDRLDLSGMLSRLGYASGDPVAGGFLKLQNDASGQAQVWANVDKAVAGAGWYLVVTLDHLSVSGLHSGDLVYAAGSATGSTGGAGGTGSGAGGAGTSGTGAAVSTSAAAYTAPAGVATITLTGSHQTVVGNDAGDTFVSNNSGNRLTGGAGADTFQIGRGGDVVTGKAGADHFNFAETPWATAHITDFAGQDVIDLSGLLARSGYAGSDPVGAGYLKLADDGAGHAVVWSNLDKVTAGAGWYAVAVLDNLGVAGLKVQGATVVAASTSTGGVTTGAKVSTSASPYVAPAGVTDITLTGSHQTVTGNDAGDVFHSNNSGNQLTGGAGADVFWLGRGGDVATGRAGADTFAFAETPWAGARITDFATAEDRIDLTGLLARSGYAGADAVADGYIRFGSDGSGSAQVWSNLDHATPGAGWYLAATLTGVSAASLHLHGAFITG